MRFTEAQQGSDLRSSLFTIYKKWHRLVKQLTTWAEGGIVLQPKDSKIHKFLGFFPFPEHSQKLVNASSSTLTFGGECMTYILCVEDPIKSCFWHKNYNYMIATWIPEVQWKNAKIWDSTLDKARFPDSNLYHVKKESSEMELCTYIF